MPNALPSLFAVADHSNRGSDFESELETVHELYLRQGIVDVVKNPSAWVYCSSGNYSQMVIHDPGSVARDGNGRPMRRVRSNVDYAGGNGNGVFIFDAKQTSGKTLPLANIHEHQILRLRRSAKCGCKAGIMVKFTSLNRVFFIDIQWLAVKFDKWLTARSRRNGKHAKNAS